MEDDEETVTPSWWECPHCGYNPAQDYYGEGVVWGLRPRPSKRTVLLCASCRAEP